MKIKVTMKDQDRMSDAVDDAVAQQVKSLNLSEDEAASLTLNERDKARYEMYTWFEYGQYLTVEFDTELMTATVLDAKEG